MPETTKLLENALANETSLFLKLINQLKDEELCEFIRLVNGLKPMYVSDGQTRIDDILHVAQSAKLIDDALDNFFVA